MKLNTLTFSWILFFIFSISTSSNGAVAIKQQATEHKGVAKEDTEELGKRIRKGQFKKNKRQKKRFRLFRFLKFKKNKKQKLRKSDQEGTRRMDSFASLSAVIGGLGALLWLFTVVDFIPLAKIFLVLIGGLLSFISLVRIKNNPTELKGRNLALIGLLTFWVLAIILGMAFLTQSWFFF